MKKILSLTLTLVLLAISLAQIQASAEIIPLTSENFRDAKIYLYSSGQTMFTATLRVQCATISVTNCTLQKLENGKWVYAASLTPPPSKTNAMVYSAVKDYSASMAHGTTYRIVATFQADGDTITKTSNAITY